MNHSRLSENKTCNTETIKKLKKKKLRPVFDHVECNFTASYHTRAPFNERAVAPYLTTCLKLFKKVLITNRLGNCWNSKKYKRPSYQRIKKKKRNKNKNYQRYWGSLNISIKLQPNYRDELEKTACKKIHER